MLNGYFIYLIIFFEIGEDIRIMKEEIFGFVVNINIFKIEVEVINKVNDIEFGLYVVVYIKNIDWVLCVVKLLEVGIVGVNCISFLGVRDMLFGGYKLSGFGREGYMVSMNNFLEIKIVLVKVEDL